MATKLIVILGITGNQGGSVATAYLHDPAWKVRGITRDPSKPSATRLSALGIDMVRADINDAASLTAAFQGAYAIFAVTDFWAAFFDPESRASAAKKGVTINEHAHDVEVAQGKKIADAAAGIGTLERFVYSALSDVRKWSGGKYRWVWHFESKAKVVEYVRGKLPGLAEKMSTVQVGFYATNWKLHPAFGPQKQSDGSFLLKEPIDGDIPVPMIDTVKDTGAFVKALLQAAPGKNVLGYGSLISKNDFMRLWSSILNVKGVFKQVSEKEFDEKFPVEMRKEVAEASEYAAEFGYAGGDPSVMHPRDLRVDLPTTSMEEYIKGEDWTSIL